MSRKRPRVLHLLGAMTAGGLQRMALNLLSGMADLDNIVVSIEPELDSWRGRFQRHARVIDCPRGTNLPGYLRRLHRIFRSTQPDLVLCYLFGNHAPASWAARLAGVPRFWVRCANDPVYYARSTWRAWIAVQSARPFCRGEIAVSSDVADVLATQLYVPRGRIHTLANGCDVESIAMGAAATRAERPPNDKLRALAVGVRPRKGSLVLVEAMELLRARGFELELWLVGKGRSQQQVREETTRRGMDDWVRFLDNRDDLPALMGRCDVLVHPTYSEGCPNAVLEAMAANLAVIASDIPACREVLDSGRCGVLVETGNAGALSDAIEGLMQDQPRRELLAALAAQRAARHYRIETVIARYRALLLGDLEMT